MLDITTLCYVNECSGTFLAANFAMNWSEVIFALNRMWTTLVSGYFGESSLKANYEYYYELGEASAMLIDDIIGFNPPDAYQYDITLPEDSDY